MSTDTKSAGQRLLSGDRSALAQALSLAEQGSDAYAELRRSINDAVRAVAVLGITGPPGAGKSSLVNAMIKEWRNRGDRVAVIAVDPSSPLSGGALLGDRVRMSAALDDDGVFIRSLSSDGQIGGLALATVRLIDLFDVAGFDRIIIETVGAGQSEIDIATVADVKFVVSAPGLGDGIQAIKSGLLEIADCLVVNKSDLSGADATAEQLRNAVSLRSHEGNAVDVVLTCATNHRGIPALVDVAEELLEQMTVGNPMDRLRARALYLVEQVAVELLRTKLRAKKQLPETRATVDALAAGEINPQAAARRLVRDCFT